LSGNNPLVALGMKRTIKQPVSSGLCLAACAATLLGENKSAFNAWSLSGHIRKMPSGLCPYLTDRRYMEMSDLTIVLALRNIRLGSWWNSGTEMDVRFTEVLNYEVSHQLNEAPALVIVRRDGAEGDGVTHAVVYDNEAQGVRDPSNAVKDEISDLKDYRIAEWFPIDVFPKDDLVQ
jgi:hypothetical protein